MKNILISGAPGTGKSVVATSTSIITGLPTVGNRPSSEIIYEHNLSRDLSTHSFKELFTIGFSNFTDRINLEKRYEEGFISDGSILNDLISIKLFLQGQSNKKHTFFNWISNRRYLKECFKMVYSLERLANDYFKYHSYDIVHLNLPNFSDASFLPEKIEYLNNYNNELIQYYKEFNSNFLVYPKSDFDVTIDQIVKDFGLHPKHSTQIALFQAFNVMHISTLNLS